MGINENKKGQKEKLGEMEMKNPASMGINGNKQI
jgi:hypothetical protein